MTKRAKYYTVLRSDRRDNSVDVTDPLHGEKLFRINRKKMCFYDNLPF